jgi:hypothetical protein
VIVNAKRKLVYRFLDLPHVRRMEVVKSLGLAEEADTDLSLYFKRAEEREILDKLWRAIEIAHGHRSGDNPFEKKGPTKTTTET